MTHHDNAYTDAAQHRAAHADTATARVAQVSPDATLVQDERFMALRQLAQAERRIAELLEDVKQGIFPGWQSYDEWVANGRTVPKRAQG